MLWKNWLINRLGSLVIVAGPRQARFFHGPSLLGFGDMCGIGRVPCPGSCRVRRCYVCVCCESGLGLFAQMAGLDTCTLCYASGSQT